MYKFAIDLFKDKTVGVGAPNSDNTKVINEAIIYDKLGNDKKKLGKFYSKLGAYGVRDGILSESAVLKDKIESLNECGCAELTALIAAAKEANAPEYDMYVKSIMLAKSCLEQMREKFGNIAKEKISEQEKVIDNNTRVQDAIAQADIDPAAANDVTA